MSEICTAGAPFSCTFVVAGKVDSSTVATGRGRIALSDRVTEMAILTAEDRDIVRLEKIQTALVDAGCQLGHNEGSEQLVSEEDNDNS